MSKASQVIILAEDQRHQNFVRRYLDQLGYKNHDLRLEPLPNGRGCGEQWVRGRYASAVKAYRARSARAATALVVVIDADDGDVGRRLRQLQDGLTDGGQAPRDTGERIVHLIPRRNIETWILGLNGEAVNEQTDYSGHSDIDQRIAAAATAFYSACRPNVLPPLRWTPSMLSAIDELRRLE